MREIMLFVIVVIVSAICLCCCAPRSTHKYVTVTEQVPYYETVTMVETRQVKKEMKVPKYAIAPCYFPLKHNVLKIAVLPFSESTIQKKGIEVAEEIEFELLRRSKKYQNISGYELLKEIKSYINDNYCGLNDEDILEWIKKYKQKRYEIVNRTLINEIIMEHSIENLTRDAITKVKNVIGVDVLLTGHVRSATSSELSFIMKAIDTSTAKVVFTERFEGNYSDSIRSAVDSFYFNIKKEDAFCTKEYYVTENVPITKQVKKYKEEKHQVYKKLCPKECTLYGTRVNCWRNRNMPGLKVIKWGECD